MTTKEEILEALSTGEAMTYKQIADRYGRYAPAVLIILNKLVADGLARVAHYEKSSGAPHAYFDNKVHLPPATYNMTSRPRKKVEYQPIASDAFPAWMR